jgi:hypothetical protein
MGDPGGTRFSSVSGIARCYKSATSETWLGGLLMFTNLVVPRNEEKGETDSAYCTCPTVEARCFLSGRLPGESPQESHHCATMRIVIGSACCEHTTSTNVEALPVWRLRPHKPGGVDLPKVGPEDPKDPPSLPNFRSQSVPIRATHRASSRP